MKPYNYVLLALGALALLSTSIFNLEAPAAWTCALIGIVLCIFGCMVKKPKTLEHIHDGLYTNDDPPQSETFPVFDADLRGCQAEEVTLHYLSRIFNRVRSWVGISEERLRQEIEDDGHFAIVFTHLDTMAKQGYIRKVHINPPNDFSRRIWIYFPTPKFWELLEKRC